MPDPHTAPPQATSEAWAETVRGCTDGDREWLIERQAIREIDGGQSRAEAEAGALQDYWRSKDGHLR